MRRAAVDERQVDLFGEAAPDGPVIRRAVKKRVRAAPPAPVAQPDPDPPAVSVALAPPVQETGLVQETGPFQETGVESLAARLSPGELDAFVAALSDDALASLVVEAVRQTRRRLVRVGRHGKTSGKAPSSPLERAAKQLAAELGGREED